MVVTNMPGEVKSLGARESVGIGFWALIATQFQGAFSDNALKWPVSFLVLESATKEYRDFLFVLVILMVFAIPFLLFSIPGGYFADRFSKKSVTIWTNILEVVVMSGATYALWVNRQDLAAVALFFASFGITLAPAADPGRAFSWKWRRSCSKRFSECAGTRFSG